MSQHKYQELTAISKTTKPGHYKIGNKIVTFTGSDTKVEQGQRYLTDLNRLLESAQKKGLLRHVAKFAGEYDDIPVQDYQEAMYKITKANSMYEKLPGNVRKEFKNPAQFLAFVQDPKNADKMQKMGILKGNDGLTASGQPSGAPTPTDKNGDGIPDPVNE